MWLYSIVALPLACKVDPQQLSKVLGNIKGSNVHSLELTHTHKMSSLYKKMIALAGLLCA